MHKLPPVAPARFFAVSGNKGSTTATVADSIFISELGALRFARDFGIMPYLMSTSQIREVFRRTNRKKVIISSRLPIREQVASRTPSIAKAELTEKAKKVE
jgi:hypothetical protein